MLPNKLKHMNLFVDGDNFVGQTEEVNLPNLERTMEEYRGAGMNGPVNLDQGMEALSMEWTAGGFMEEPLRQFGILDVSGVVLLWVGSYDSEDGSGIKSVEIEARGRHSGIEMGTAKPGEDSNQKMTSQLSYYKVTVNNEVIIEIDFINMIEKIGGVDRLEQHRRNLLIN